MSVFADLDERRAVFVTEGRDQATVQAFAGFLESHGGQAAQVKEVCQDMSEAFLAGSLKQLPQAEIRFDRYHIRSHLSKALDDVRRAEAKQHHGLLKNARYLWLRRRENLTERQQDWLDELLQRPLEIVRVYELALRFDAFYALDDPDTAQEYLRRWITEVKQSDIKPLIKFAGMLEDHWPGVMRWHHSASATGC